MTDRTTRRVVAALVLVVALVAAGCAAPFGGGSPTESPTATPETATATRTPTPTGIHASYAETTVDVVDGETGEELGRVEAAIADEQSLRVTGLSETDEMPENRGMLFVYDDAQNLTFWMRNMSFPLDIVFVYGNGTIESIHHVPAPAPGEDGTEIRVSGTGRFVLEVNRGWTTDRGVEAGDRIAFDLPE